MKTQNKEKLDSIILVRISKKDQLKFKTIAQKVGVKRSKLIRKAIKELIETKNLATI